MAAAAPRKPCVYCLDTQALRPEQVLVRGGRFYVCAPRGQLVEGYLAIAPYQCIGSLSLLDPDDFAELADLQALCAAFYRDAYGVDTPVFYEQGRGGGGAQVDPDGNFPIHAHLCGLPLSLPVHEILTPRYVARVLNGPHQLRTAVGHNPYVYADCLDGPLVRRQAYVGHTEANRRELEQSRLKPMIARLAGLPDRGDWRSYPGDAELERVIRRFAEWIANGKDGGNGSPGFIRCATPRR